MKQVAARIAKAQWPGRAFAVAGSTADDPRNLQFPFKKGETRAEKSKAAGKDGSFFNGHVVLDARSGEQYPPLLLVRDAAGELRQLTGQQTAIEGKQKFYNGCWVAASVSFKAYMSQNEGGIGAYSGVKAFLSSVIWLRGGDRIGGNAVETFRHFAGAVTAENPTAGDQEIPF
jgi:hypothetical protein